MNFKEFELIYFNLIEFDMKSWFKVEKIKDFLDLQSYFYIRINSGQIQSKISLFWLFLSIFVYLAPISNLVTLYGFVVKFYVKLTSFSFMLFIPLYKAGLYWKTFSIEISVSNSERNCAHVSTFETLVAQKIPKWRIFLCTWNKIPNYFLMN